jgi:hypothetical protein
MNHHGLVPWPPPTLPVKFRSSFPVKYFLIDFGYSEHLTPGSDGLIKPVAVRREQCPPEMSRSGRIDPFAADVYSTARLFYGFFEVSPPFFYTTTTSTKAQMPEDHSLSSRPLRTVARHVVL